MDASVLWDAEAGTPADGKRFGHEVLKRVKQQPRSAVAAVLVWLLAAATGFAFLLTYENTPGAERVAPTRWPGASSVSPASQRPTLVMFAHPSCPCTRASLGELAVLLAQCQGAVEAHVVFIQTAAAEHERVPSGLWATAEAIPGVQVHADPGGAEARQFGAETSGHTVLYSAGGKLLFAGGITGGRGHAGDNAGRSAVTALLRNTAPESRQACVYGCSLFNSTP